MLAVKAGAGLAAMPHWQGDSESELVRVIDNIGLVCPTTCSCTATCNTLPEFGPSPTFVASEIKSFRALVSDGNLTDT